MNGVDKLKKIAHIFEKSGLSPLEKFLCVYNYTTKYKYPDIKQHNDYIEYGRNMKNIVETGQATCLGAANIIDTMLDTLKIHDSVSEMFFYDKNRHVTGRHANNIVKLQDDDYRVRGVYGADACHDMGATKYRFCLFPLWQADELYKEYGNIAYIHEAERAKGSPWEAFEFSRMHDILGIPEITNENYNFYQQGRNLDNYLSAARRNFYQIVQCREIDSATLNRALSAVEKAGAIS